MSTFLVSFGVVTAAIVAVVHVVLNNPDQPATIRRQPSRAKPRRRVKPQVAATGMMAAPAPPRPPVAMPVATAFAGPDSDIMRLRALPARSNSMWVRIRSGVALVVLVAILGALLALSIAGVMLGIALLVRSATA